MNILIKVHLCKNMGSSGSLQGEDRRRARAGAVGAARAAGSPSGFCGANPRVWRPPLCIVPLTTYSCKTVPESQSGDAAGRLLGSKTKLVKRSEPRPGAAGPTLKRWGFLSFTVWAQEVPEAGTAGGSWRPTERKDGGGSSAWRPAPSARPRAR